MLFLQKFTFFFLFFFGFQLHAQDFNKTKIDEILANKIEGIVPGLAVGIVKDGQIIYEQYLGYSNLEHKIKVNQHTRFNIASVAKQFTALCVLQLHLDGKLNLEEDFRKHLPQYFPKIENKISIAHLLTHSSGIRDVYDLMSIQGEPWWSQVGFSNEDALQLLEKQEELNFKVGTEYLYSNSGYLLLTELVAELSGQEFNDYAVALFEKYGMKNTRFSTNYMTVVPNKALPYSDWGDGVWKQYPMVVDLHGDGFLHTTLKDQLLWELALQNQKDQLTTQSQQPIPNFKLKTYGFGLEFDSYKNYKVVQHSGSTGSYHAHTMRFPKEKLSIVILSNNGNLWSRFIANEIADALLQIPEKMAEETKQNTPKTEDKTNATAWNTLTKNHFQSLNGSYLNSETDTKFRLTYQSNQSYQVQVFGKEREAVMIAEEQLKMGDFKMRVQRNELGQVAAILVDYNRNKNIRFAKQEQNDFITSLPTEDGGKISVSTIGGNHGKAKQDILLTKNNREGNEEWFKIFGGKSYDKASSILATTDGGYLIVGSTSSYGAGNYDMYILKVDEKGKEQWSNTFGGELNEYGFLAENQASGYLIKGSKQICTDVIDFTNCKKEIWTVEIDEFGKKKSSSE